MSNTRRIVTPQSSTGRPRTPSSPPNHHNICNDP
jgi:hypothetical protein